MSKKCKIFITGGDGFLGQHIVPTILTHFEMIHLKNDLRNYGAVESEIKNTNPDIILHLAARTEVEKSFYEQLTFSEINYLGTINHIEDAARHSHNLKNFLFASTMEVYGRQPIGDETAVMQK